MRFEVSFHHVSWRPLLVMVILACGACTRLADHPENVAGNDTGPKQNGVYAVLREAETPEEARGRDTRCLVLPYDRKYTDSGVGEPVRYVAIDPGSFVPMILEGAPDATKDDGGKTIRSVTLKKEYVKPLKDFTRAQLNGKIAILLDGEIIKIHKVRSVISEGKFVTVQAS